MSQPQSDKVHYLELIILIHGKMNHSFVLFSIVIDMNL